MKILRAVDLSVPVEEATVVYHSDPSPRIRPACTIGEDGFNVLDVHMGSQTGTHVDAPYHFREDGLRIDELDLTLFMGSAVLVDVTGLAPRTPIGWSRFEGICDRLKPGVIVLLRTGWDKHYGTDAYFDHPYLDAEACERMLATGVRTVLLDAINLDETPDEDHPGAGYPCHHQIASVAGVIGENMRGLDQITWPDPFIMALPLRLAGGDGAPVRAVAVEFER